ncbi:hypothetical protein [Verrucomicrobium spinosum]|uniref:hypothetical protein n=1 Tax=Verrucomicrobium spinosum TaxID=2736 RepID=UPI000AEF51B6|nr:hypothetical protein [Verrucomicrobium spinosum]
MAKPKPIKQYDCIHWFCRVCKSDLYVPRSSQTPSLRCAADLALPSWATSSPLRGSAAFATAPTWIAMLHRPQWQGLPLG